MKCPWEVAYQLHKDKYTKEEHSFILKDDIKYIDKRKNYYKSKIESMTGLKDYLEQKIYI